jgi:hypothetical protein
MSVAVREIDIGGGAPTTTVLSGVDLQQGVATYVISKPSVYTTYTTVTKYMTNTLRTYISVATLVRRTYTLPDGKVYTVLTVPTKMALASSITTITGTQTSTGGGGQAVR